MKILKYSSFIITCIICLFAISCNNQKPTILKKNKTKDISTGEGKYIISAPIVAKKFVDVDGKIENRQEYFIERSIQDYFIKFCESKVSREEFETYLSKKPENKKTATLEVEYVDGNWDECEETNSKQGRIGTYIIIHNII